MNGGAVGAFHINAPWGDPLYASLYGSTAVADGADSWQNILAGMNEEPEPFTLPGAEEAAAVRSTCEEKCQGLGLVQKQVCEVGCRVQDIGQIVAVMVVGAGLILIGALAFIKD